jgi:hypothetical protein
VAQRPEPYAYGDVGHPGSRTQCRVGSEMAFCCFKQPSPRNTANQNIRRNRIELLSALRSPDERRGNIGSIRAETVLQLGGFMRKLEFPNPRKAFGVPIHGLVLTWSVNYSRQRRTNQYGKIGRAP